MRLDYWNDHSAYKDKQGNIIPEYLYFMIMIKGYYNIKEIDEIKAASANVGSSKKKSRSELDYDKEE